MAAPAPTDPVTIPLPADTWTKVGDDLQNITIKTADTRPKFYVYDKITHGSTSVVSDATAIQFPSSGIIAIEESVGMDYYVKPVGAAGSVITWPGTLVFEGR